MDIDEYIWKNKLLITKLAKECDTCYNSLLRIKNRRGGATLLLALKILYLTDGAVSIETLLSKSQQKEFEEWQKKIDQERGQGHRSVTLIDELE